MVKSVLVAAIVQLLIRTPAIIGWLPRVEFLTSSCLRRHSDVGGQSQRRGIFLSASNARHDHDRQIDGDSDQPDGPGPFLAGGGLSDYVSRLEAIITDSESYREDSDVKSQRLLKGGERVVVGDWMGWEEGPCRGDSCGDEFEVSHLLACYFAYDFACTNVVECVLNLLFRCSFRVSNVTFRKSSK